MLAFRIHIAVAEILIRKHKLPNGTWGIEIEEDGSTGNITDKIKKFEDRHKEIIIKMTQQKDKSAECSDSFKEISEQIRKAHTGIETGTCRLFVGKFDHDDDGEVLEMYIAVAKRKKKDDKIDGMIIPLVKTIERIEHR